MKSKIFFGFCVFVLFFLGCNTDDDICLDGEATPRLKVKFKTQSTGNVRSMDSIFVSVDYGNGAVSVISNTTSTDSVMLPLRVDDALATSIYVKTASNGVSSKVTINYTTESSYVSPACGVKRIYKNVNYSLGNTNPVLAIEPNQNEIVDENKTHLYLLF